MFPGKANRIGGSTLTNRKIIDLSGDDEDEEGELKRSKIDNNFPPSTSWPSSTEVTLFSNATPFEVLRVSPSPIVILKTGISSAGFIRDLAFRLEIDNEATPVLALQGRGSMRKCGAAENSGAGEKVNPLTHSLAHSLLSSLKKSFTISSRRMEKTAMTRI